MKEEQVSKMMSFLEAHIDTCSIQYNKPRSAKATSNCAQGIDRQQSRTQVQREGDITCRECGVGHDWRQARRLPSVVI